MDKQHLGQWFGKALPRDRVCENRILTLFMRSTNIIERLVSVLFEIHTDLIQFFKENHYIVN